MPLTKQRSADDAWQQLADNLALCLADLDEDDFLIVESKHANHYVQFVAQGAFGMRVEAACNSYIEPQDVLSVEDYAKMAELGWGAATYSTEKAASGERSPDGSPNFFIDVDQPVDFAQLAQIAVLSLREVYRAPHPGRLQYSAFSKHKTQIRFPTLRIKRRKD